MREVLIELITELLSSCIENEISIFAKDGYRVNYDGIRFKASIFVKKMEAICDGKPPLSYLDEEEYEYDTHK